MSKFVIALVVVVVLIAAGIGYMKLNSNKPAPVNYTNNATGSNTASSSNANASGNPDDIVNAAISGSTQTDAIVKQSDNEAAATSSDTQTINSFSGVYNDTEVQ